MLASVVANTGLGSHLFLGHLGEDSHLCLQQSPSRDYSCHCVEIATTHDASDWFVDQVRGGLVLRLVLSSAEIHRLMIPHA